MIWPQIKTGQEIYLVDIYSINSWHGIRKLSSSSGFLSPPREELIMKILSNLLVIGLVMLGIVAILPLISISLAVVFGVFVFATWFLPFWIIATSDKTTGFEKIAWLLAMFCLSWFAWVFYFFLAPLKPRHHYYY